MTVYKPLIIVVPEDVYALLHREASELEPEFVKTPEAEELYELCDKNGWTFEMLAVGAWLTLKLDQMRI